MSKHHYYYLVSGLPDMALEQSKLPISLPELMEQLKLSLHPDDLQQARLLFLPADNRNLLRLVQKEEFAWDAFGRFSRPTMEEGLKEPQLLPPYMARFHHAYRNDEPLWPNMSWENQLARLSYEYQLQQANAFLHQWFTFENHLKNFLAAWNIREYERSPEGQFIGDNIVTRAAQQSHARDLGLAAELPFLDKLLHALDQDSLLERERAIALIKWNYIEELSTFHYFSVEAVLSYLIKWMMLHRWTQMDPEKGQALIRRLAREMEEHFTFPNQFALV